MTRGVFDSRIKSILRSLCLLGFIHPKLSLMVVVMAAAASGLLIVFGPLEVSTSRRNLLSRELPHQERMERFFERFGRPDTLVLVIESGSIEQRRRVVDELIPRLEKISRLESRVLGQFGPEQFAELIFLHRPDLLKDLAHICKGKCTDLLRGSLDAWFRVLQRKIQAGLDGESREEPAPNVVAANAAALFAGVQALNRLADLIDALEGELSSGAELFDLNAMAGVALDDSNHEYIVDDRGYLVDEKERLHLVVMFPDLASDEGKHLSELVERIRAARDQALDAAGAADVRAQLTGDPALSADELSILQRGMRKTSILTALGILLLLLFSFRSLRYALLTLVPLTAGIIITLGFAQLVYGGLNLVTSSFVSILLGLGIDFGVHLNHRYGEERRLAGDNSNAMRVSVQASNKSAANSPVKPSAPAGPATMVLAVPDARGRGRRGDSNRTAPGSVPVLQDELAAVVAKQHYPRERIAMRRALLRASPGIGTGALTTILAFMTVSFTDFTAFAELGVIAVIGIGVMLCCTFMLIPSLMRLFARDGLAPTSELPGLVRLVSFVARVPRAVLGLAGVALVFSITSIIVRGPVFDGRFFNFLPEQTESVRALRRIENLKGMGPVFANFEVDSFQAARALAVRLRTVEEIAQVQSVTDMLPPLDNGRRKALSEAVALFGERSGVEVPSHKQTKGVFDSKRLIAAVTDLRDTLDEVAFALGQAGRDAEPARRVSASLLRLGNSIERLANEQAGAIDRVEGRIAGLLYRALSTAQAVARRGSYAPEDIPRIFRPRFISKDGSRLALYAYPSADIWDAGFAERFTRSVFAIDPEASGLAVNVHQNERLVIDGFIQAAVLSAVLVALTLLLVFRNAADASLALLPVILGWVWMLAVMPPLGLSFNLANIVALPLLLGIGLDAGTHMVHRYRESRAIGNDCARLSDLVQGTGAAVIVASLTTMIGFGALTAAEYRAMQSMGLLLSVGIGLSMLASVVVLPALLVLLKRVK
ncbi:MAG: MMPL family transporter [Deltaproteobacteria bacterium]|nr:MMPL family transporter [Deltaproteobacteria bacterium]